MTRHNTSSNSVSYGFVRLILVKPFLEELKRRGVSYVAPIRPIGLDEHALNDPERYVLAETMYAIFDALAEAAADPHLGYHVGSKLDFASWPPFQSATEHAQTVGEFMTEFIAAVPSEANSVRHELSVTSTGACYRIHRLIETKASPQHTEAFGAAVFVRLFQAITGKTWKSQDVLIRTAHSQALPKRVQGVKIEGKSAGGLEIHFPIGWLHEPIELHSTLRNQRPQTTQLEEHVSLLSVFRASAKAMLEDLGAGLPEVAAKIGVTQEDLQAALRSEGTSAAKEFRQLRIDVAKSRLKTSDEKVSSIAGALGYSDHAHFTRFFKTQTGQSPRAYRNAQRNKV